MLPCGIRFAPDVSPSPAKFYRDQSMTLPVGFLHAADILRHQHRALKHHFTHMYSVGLAEAWTSDMVRVGHVEVSYLQMTKGIIIESC
jgi:hypothetical protein